MKTLTHSHRLVVRSPRLSAGGATDDRPGRKPGFTGTPAARAPAGRQNPTDLLSCARMMRRTLPLVSWDRLISRQDAKGGEACSFLSWCLCVLSEAGVRNQSGS